MLWGIHARNKRALSVLLYVASTQGINRQALSLLCGIHTIRNRQVTSMSVLCTCTYFPECPICTNPSQVCDPVSGRCSCPPLTAQPRCDRCLPGAWGFHPQRGCQACDCDVSGADMTQCDASTGQCLCKDAYMGRKCDQCLFGYFSFPQ